MISLKIQNALESLKLRFNKIQDTEELTVYNLNMALDTIQTDCYIEVRKTYRQVIIRTIANTIIPQERRKQIAEFFTRLNYILTLGNFAMNLETGEYEFRCAYLYDELSVDTEDIFSENLFRTFRVLDDFLPGIMGITYGNKVPQAEFLRLTESPNHNLN